MADTSEQDLTLKQRKFIKFYLELGNATEAVIKAGYDCKDRETASAIGYENLRKLHYEDFLEEAGITDDLLQKKIIEGLNSNKVISARVILKKGQTAEEIKQEANSRTDDFVEVPDNLTRHKYLETALKLKKRLIERKDITSDDKPLDFKVISYKDIKNE
jgi:hypothetical protein